MARAIRDITGQTFGWLTAVQIVGTDKHNGRIWQCKCMCGGDVEVALGRLHSGNTRSCGKCKRYGLLPDPTTVKTQKYVRRKPRNSRHGMSTSLEYHSWSCMLSRCSNPLNPGWKDYGGRGITVCDEWQKDFVAFYNHVGPRPTPDHSIDRINNDGNYEPGNVRWATDDEQRANRRCSKK
jgi:hypothetical protein